MKKINTFLAFFFIGLMVISAIAQGRTGDQETPGRKGDVEMPGAPRSARAGETKDGTGADVPANLINSSNYTFSSQSGIALEDMSGGTSLLLGSNQDNDSSAVAPIGFLFRFDGVNYTTFGVNINGLARLGDIVTTTSTLNALNSVANSPKLMPYWDDLCSGVGGKVHYKTTGTFGNRKLIVEWSNMKVTRGGSCDGSGSGTFQMWMFEGTGVVQFVYGNGINGSSNGGYSVGIQSGGADNFASVTTASNTVDYSSANNAQMNAITAGTSYLFSPAVPATPTGGSVSPLRETSLRLNWTDNASGESGYIVSRSTDNVNFTLIGQLPADSTSFSDSGLSPSTQYFYSVSAMGVGAFSPGLTFSPTTNSPGSVNATAAGGLWSSSATWAGGQIPDGADTVTIPSGATVIIDTDALAGSVKLGTVGSLSEGSKEISTEGGSAAVLRFADDVACSLTVAGSVTIGANDSFTTGSGTVITHNLLVGGDLINNGTLDFSTNNNQAGANIIFNGNSSNTFGGTGAVTDIRTITVNKGPTNANILELSPSNFTVQGSSTEGPGSNYLTLNAGTFKISGTFSGTHRTFTPAAYSIGASAGVWLNNPNYTIVGIDDMSFVSGLMRISAGTWNVSGNFGQPMTLFAGSTTIIEGGNLNLTQALSGSTNYTQTGGKVTTCTLAIASSASSTCFGITGAVTLSGGEIVIQNRAAPNLGGQYDYFVNVGAGTAGMGSITGTTLRFGNALTAGATNFRAGGVLPNVVIDATAGNHKLTLAAPQEGTSTRNMTVPAGATLEFSRYNMMGATFVNNGTLNIPGSGIGYLSFDDLVGTADLNYTGVGTMTGQLFSLNINGHSMTFDPSAGNLRAWNVTITKAQVVNAARITFGTGTAQLSTIELRTGATLDSAPDFNITTGGEKVVYTGSGALFTGPEIKPDRILHTLQAPASGTLTITGGDLAVVNTLNLAGTVIKTGTNILRLQASTFRTTGYVDGNVRRDINSLPGNFIFPVGQNGYSPVTLQLTALNGPSYLIVTPVDATLPGLLPATSLHRYWQMVEGGDITGILTFEYPTSAVRGNPATYKLWYSNGGPPAQVPGAQVQNPNMIKTQDGTNTFTGYWGVGNDLDPGPVSISGRVATSGGAGIRNATVEISGGGLPGPITVQTGSLGTYGFTNLQAGETYTVKVSAKRFRFTPNSQQVTPMVNLASVDFTANPPEEF